MECAGQAALWSNRETPRPSVVSELGTNRRQAAAGQSADQAAHSKEAPLSKSLTGGRNVRVVSGLFVSDLTFRDELQDGIIDEERQHIVLDVGTILNVAMDEAD